jgi:hypothetical protein
MSSTTGRAVGNGRLRAGNETQTAALARRPFLPLRAPGARRGLPLGIALEIVPTHIPLPAKIRTELLDPIDVEHDPQRAGDVEYVDQIYREVQAAIHQGMNRLAARRRFPVSG